GRLGDDLDVVLQLEEGREALADDGVIVGDHDADLVAHAASSRRTVVPLPGAEMKSRRPPSASARSCIDVRPRRFERMRESDGSKPTPSSQTASVRVPFIST